jgi:hypothetical protein
MISSTTRSVVRAVLAAAILLGASGAARAQVLTHTLVVPAGPYTGEITFIAFLGPAEGYLVGGRMHLEFVPSGPFTAAELDVSIQLPCNPNHAEWIVQGGPTLGWDAAPGLHVGDAAADWIGGQIGAGSGFPGAVYEVVIASVPGSQNGVWGDLSNSWIELDYLPLEIGSSVPICPGSGCPCGNDGVAPAGCAHSSSPSGAQLLSRGIPSIAHDGLVLAASALPSSSTVVFLQANDTTSPTVFGAGLSCIGGNLLRLGVRSAQNGAASFGANSGVLLSSFTGLGAAGGSRRYQAWYRDPVGPCTGTTFNLTNALETVWVP